MYKPLPITLPAGIVRSGTSYAVKDRYYDAQLVRFHEGKPQRWGGWQKFVDGQLDGPCRGVLAWTALDGNRFVAFGTTDKLWLLSDAVLYDITPVGLGSGYRDASGAYAVGEGKWGEGPWGGTYDPRTGVVVEASTWSLAKWGEDLIAVRRGSTAYHWKKTDGVNVKAQAIVGAPSVCLGVIVTEDRHVVFFGAHDGTNPDPIRLQWPNQETLTDFLPTATSTAGDLRLDDGNTIRAAIPILGGHLFLTDVSAYTWKYIGGGFVFAKERQAGKNGIIGPNAGIEMDGIAYWMGDDAFYKFDGVVTRIECDVHDFVFKNVNRDQVSKIYAGTNNEFGEFVIFYPDTTSLEPNRYVSVNRRGEWSIGALTRTSWIDESVVSKKPLATDESGYIYEHEVGTTADGTEFSYSLSTGQIEIKPQGSLAANEQFYTVRKIIPDFEDLAGSHWVSFDLRRKPNATPRRKGPYGYKDAETGYVDPRARGMTMQLIFEGTGHFRMGDISAHITGGGGR